jgi:hypothetical protein
MKTRHRKTTGLHWTTVHATRGLGAAIPCKRLRGYPAGARIYAAGTGNAVTDLIFSIAKRDVTFFSGTAPISFL